jgi:hypothetical protein
VTDPTIAQFRRARVTSALGGLPELWLSAAVARASCAQSAVTNATTASGPRA